MDCTIVKFIETGRKNVAFNCIIWRRRLVGRLDCIVVEVMRYLLGIVTMQCVVLRENYCALCNSRKKGCMFEAYNCTVHSYRGKNELKLVGNETI